MLKMRIQKVLLALLGIIVSSGAYVMFHNILYILCFLLIILFLKYLYVNDIKIDAIFKRHLIVFVLYSAGLFFFATIESDQDSIRLFFNYFAGPLIYIILLNHLRYTNCNLPSHLPLMVIIMILVGIYLQLIGVVTSQYLNEFSGDNTSLGVLQRPSGFLNANMISGIALVWLYVGFKMTKFRKKQDIFNVLIVLFIILITQSRAALFFYSVSMFYIIIKFMYLKSELRLLLVSIILIFILGVYQTNRLFSIIDIFVAVIDRGIFDDSFFNRFNAIFSSVEMWSESPLLGCGMRSLVRVTGLGAHNELFEWLVNFGILGFFLMIILFASLYLVKDSLFICMCIMPNFLFSHNFFENTAFQVALAFACYCAIKEPVYMSDYG